MGSIPQAFAHAVQQHQAGNLHQAERIYRQILQADPFHADAMHLLGVIAHQAGQHAFAIDFIRNAITIHSSNPTYHCNLGAAYYAAGKLDEAIKSYEKSLRIKPDYSEAHYNLGLALLDQGKLEEAEASCRQALLYKPDYADAHNNLAAVLQKRGKRDQVVGCYQQVVRLRPTSPEAHNSLGTALAEMGQLDAAMLSYREALRLNPNHAEAHRNIGVALRTKRQLDEALASFQRALRVKPNFPEAYNSLGNVFLDKGNFDQAAACYQQALRLKPAYAEAYSNLGIALAEQGNVEEALRNYREALRIKPDHADAHFNQALTWLLQGNYEQGWPEYEWRWQRGDARPRNFTQPEWDGSPLAGRTILLHAEQGLGDTFLFVRYARLVKQQGGTVIVECQHQVIPLLSKCPYIDRILVGGSPLPDFDVHAAIMSLPRILRTTLATVPAEVPYLFPEPALIDHWRDMLPNDGTFKIGIAWQGKPSYGADRHRSIPLHHFAPLARLDGVRLFSLQKGPGVEQIAQVADQFVVTELSKLDETTGPFMDTAALMKNLDLIISPDTAITHLAGGLAAPVWLGLSYSPFWPWLLKRQDSPWYPTVRLFRQERFGDWEGVFAAMTAELSKRLAERAGARS